MRRTGTASRWNFSARAPGAKTINQRAARREYALGAAWGSSGMGNPTKQRAGRKEVRAEWWES